MKKTQPIPKEKKAKFVLLDQWRVDVYIAPTRELTDKELGVLRVLMNSYLHITKSRIMNDLDNKIRVVVSR